MTRLVLLLAALAVASLTALWLLLRQHTNPEGFGLPDVEDDTPWMQGFGTFSELERGSAA